MINASMMHAPVHLAFYLAISLVLALALALLLWPRATVGSFRDCVRAGNPVAESSPRQCHTPDGRVFWE